MKYLLPLLILFAITACGGEDSPEGKGLKYTFRNSDGSTENGTPGQDFYAKIEIKNRTLEIYRYHYKTDERHGVANGKILESKKNRDHYYYLIQNAFGDSQIGVFIYTGNRSDIYVDSIHVERREARNSPYDEDLIISGDIRWKGKYRKL